MNSMRLASMRFAKEQRLASECRLDDNLLLTNTEENDKNESEKTVERKAEDRNEADNLVLPEGATLEGQFSAFSKLFEEERDGTTITLFRSDYWMRQAKIIDDRHVTMTETGILFNRYSKTELTMDEWLDFLSNLCDLLELDEVQIKDSLTQCGQPGEAAVLVPQYRDYFITYKAKQNMLYE